MNDILSLLKNDERQRLIIRKLEKDQTLFHEGDLCEQIGILMKGQIAIISYLPDGRQIIYNRLREKEIFGNNLLFSSDPFYKGNIIAEEETQVALLSKDDLICILSRNKEFLEEYLKIQSDLGKKLNSRIRLLSLAGAEERFLLYMHEHRDLLTYASISDLAKDLYLSREALSRLLSRFEKEKRIIRERKTIRLL